MKVLTHIKSVTVLFIIMIIIGSPMVSFAQVSDAERKQLETELAQLQAEINQKQAELDGQKKNSASLSRDVTLLTTQINQAKLQIVAKNKVLQQLGGQITQKNKNLQNSNS
jgi:septal ring factor EnvC (AmiA/AmiB activator)